VIVAGLRQEQDLYIRLIDSATKQVRFILYATIIAWEGERARSAISCH